MVEQSLYQAARLEAERYRDQLTQRMGDAFGAEAISEWNRTHWWAWACERVLEHVRGEVFWPEFDASRFATFRLGHGHPKGGDIQAIAHQIQHLRDRMDEPNLGFRERRHLEERLGDLVNRLLA